MPAPLILTLKLDRASFDYFDDLRRKYFPPERNFLSAHLTLFHHLPGENLDAIRNELDDFCRNKKPFPLDFPGWRFLGKGVAVRVESNELNALRAHFASVWRAALTAQDKQRHQPHITVQNKVAPDEAKALFERLDHDWKPLKGTADGLQLWHYLGGKWKLEREFLFSE